MKISIITPVYEGKKYLYRYMENMRKAALLFLDEPNSLEIIFVNDSPWEKISHLLTDFNEFEVKVIENKRNCGIHQSRVNGLKEAKGDYVIFLDQDDELLPLALANLKRESKDSDVIIGNGYFEFKDRKEKIFANKLSHRLAAKPFVYFWIRDFIVSPGQCLIKKSSIPKYWIEHPMKHNGTDDYFLWLLMHSQKTKMTTLNSFVYVHKYTGKNLSDDDKKMKKSTEEMISLLRKNNKMNRKRVQLIERRISYKNINRKNLFFFIKESIKNLDIFIVNVCYRIVFRGCLIREKNLHEKE